MELLTGIPSTTNKGSIVPREGVRTPDHDTARAARGIGIEQAHPGQLARECGHDVGIGYGGETLPVHLLHGCGESPLLTLDAQGGHHEPLDLQRLLCEGEGEIRRDPGPDRDELFFGAVSQEDRPHGVLAYGNVANLEVPVIPAQGTELGVDDRDLHSRERQACRGVQSRPLNGPHALGPEAGWKAGEDHEHGCKPLPFHHIRHPFEA